MQNIYTHFFTDFIHNHNQSNLINELLMKYYNNRVLNEENIFFKITKK